MPNIKPVSDLRNYGAVLRDVTIGSPVFLTKNGHGRYAVMDMEDYKEYEKMMAWQTLKAELEKGRRSGEEEGWLSAEEVRIGFEERANIKKAVGVLSDEADEIAEGKREGATAKDIVGEE